MKALWLSVPAVAAMMMAGAANADLDLAKKSGCLSCHAIDKKVIGPAWKDVAAKYKGDAKAKDSLTASIRSGSKGKWGKMAMPPQKKPSDADVATLVDFILGL